MKMRVMAEEREHHGDEELWERYSMGAISEEQATALEEHLITCESCRGQLAEVQDYVRGMQHAGMRVRKETRVWFQVFPRFVPALAALALVVAGINWFRLQQRPALPPIAVSLTATRGVSAVAHAPAGRPLQLQPDLQGLTAPASRVEIVDDTGRRVWQGTLDPSQRTAATPATRAGLYFVRLYSAGGTLLREYALETAAAR